MLKVDQLSKSYPQQDKPAVDRLSFEVVEGETLALLGPSGCGKTTALRLLAGLEQPDTGSIFFRGQAIDSLAAEQRQFGMVFQDYALFPHLTVAENIAFGLVVKGMNRTDQVKVVGEWLERLQLSGLADRYPAELSGGQQQRVAVARALAPAPTVLLLDEPFSNLDAQLRLALQIELKNILKAAGQTTILVTHDQSEAFTLADQVLIMRNGAKIQQGTPSVVYATPASAWVAGFLGHQNIKGTYWWPQEAFRLVGEPLAMITELVFWGDTIQLQVRDPQQESWQLVLSRREWVGVGQPAVGGLIPFIKDDTLRHHLDLSS